MFGIILKQGYEKVEHKYGMAVDLYGPGVGRPPYGICVTAESIEAHKGAVGTLC